MYITYKVILQEKRKTMNRKNIINTVVLFAAVMIIVGCASSSGGTQEKAPYAFGSICEKDKTDGQKYNILTISSYNAIYKNFRVTSISPTTGDSVSTTVPAVPSILAPYGASYREQCDEGRIYKVTALGESAELNVDVFYKQN